MSRGAFRVQAWEGGGWVTNRGVGQQINKTITTWNTKKLYFSAFFQIEKEKMRLDEQGRAWVELSSPPPFSLVHHKFYEIWIILRSRELFSGPILSRTQWDQLFLDAMGPLAACKTFVRKLGILSNFQDISWY